MFVNDAPKVEANGEQEPQADNYHPELNLQDNELEASGILPQQVQDPVLANFISAKEIDIEKAVNLSILFTHNNLPQEI